MKAVIYEKYGPPEVLKLKEVDKPIPENNEVLVKIYASVVTTGDIRIRKADPFIARTFNGLLTPKRKILGMNFAGKIAEVGKTAEMFREGDKVFGSTVFEFGTYAEYVCISENGVITTMPSNLTYEEAAAVPFGALTSLHFLRKGNIKPGDEILICGASGSLGTAAVQLAKYLGAEVTGICSTINLELVKSLGADKVIDYTKEDFAENNRTYDIVYDTVGKLSFFAGLNKLNKNGIFLDAVHIPPLSILEDLWVSITSSKKIIGGTSIERKDDLEFLKVLIEKDKFKPVIDRSYSLEQITDAHRYVEEGHKKGNVVITIDHNN